MKTDNLKAIPTILMPGNTISGLIKKINLFKADPEETKLLLKQFANINEPQVLKPGMRVMIPVLSRLEDEVFNH